MKGGEVDLDRLADYVGGALDGTPDADAVRRLVDNDPGWRRAHADLVEALPAVQADLTRLRDLDLRMPADVAERLDRAIESAPVPKMTPVRQANGNLVDLAEQRRRRRYRWTMTAAVAASVAVCGVIGVNLTQVLTSRSDDSAGVSSNQYVEEDKQKLDSPAGGQRAPGAAPAQSNVIASGRDYQVGTLAGALAGSGGATSASERSLNENPGFSAPSGLAPLTSSAARARCLNAILREYGGAVSLVDYARFEGAPALVVVLTGAKAAAGGRWVVVVGPTCGQNDAISDERYNGHL